MNKTNFAVGGYWHCDKCGEEYHSSQHHICEPTVTAIPEPTDEDLEKLSNRAMGVLVHKYGYPQAEKFVNWAARPEEIALEMAEFVYRIQPLLATNDLAIAEAYRCGYESGKAEAELKKNE